MTSLSSPTFAWLYIVARPAISEQCLSLTAQGKVRYQLKTPYADGTIHVIFEPLDFIVWLAALAPKPRVNPTRYHGLFAPNSQHLMLVTPAKRGKDNQPKTSDEPECQTPAERRTAMTWAQRLKRVFNIDIETCTECGGCVDYQTLCGNQQQPLTDVRAEHGLRPGRQSAPTPKRTIYN